MSGIEALNVMRQLGTHLDLAEWESA